MTTFTLTIQTEGAAFEDGPEHELARMLGVTANRLLCGDTSGPVLDINGNVRGHFGIDEHDGPAVPEGPDGTEPWGELLERLPDGVAISDRFTVRLAGAGVHVSEYGADDVYWPVGRFSARVTRAALVSGIAVAAYQATVDAVAALDRS
jgi:hypothetical protein